MYLGNLVFDFINKRSFGGISLDFSIPRAIWQAEQVVIEMGVFAGDNKLTQENLMCQVTDSSGSPSTLWRDVNIYAGADGLPLSSIYLIPSMDIISVQTFVFKCNGVVTPYSYNPQPISGYFGLQNSVTVIYQANIIDVESAVTKDESLMPINSLQIL